MKILGVDPGLRITGYGVIEVLRSANDFEIKLIEAGVIKTVDQSGIATRLEKIHRGLSEVIDELKPECLVIEKLYAHIKHPATSILMGHARGVVCLLSASKNIELVSMASTHVKKSVTGRGHAGKSQIQRMVQHALGLKVLPEPPDVADALAVAISYASTLRKSNL